MVDEYVYDGIHFLYDKEGNCLHAKSTDLFSIGIEKDFHFPSRKTGFYIYNSKTDTHKYFKFVHENIKPNQDVFYRFQSECGIKCLVKIIQ